ncbi:hypothetical protein Bbelb_202020 [Branchiostoma belcheri]|nr:hypothetical protein Bbelb_202020 [Branchiostoma belcheri]
MGINWQNGGHSLTLGLIFKTHTEQQVLGIPANSAIRSHHQTFPLTPKFARRGRHDVPVEIRSFCHVTGDDGGGSSFDVHLTHPARKPPLPANPSAAKPSLGGI